MAERYPETLVDEVLARTDLLRVVEPYVKVVRRGHRHVGLCPFHSEKTPSFSVSPEQGLFYCFGCGAGGSAVQFLMRIEGWGFRDALGELARRAGVVLPQPDAQQAEADRRRRSERDGYLDVLEEATRYYEGELQSGRHAQAVSYLRERGVDEETGRAFRLGYAPDDWEGVVRALRRNKVGDQAVEGAGLALPRKGGGVYDRFRDRIMFPVMDRMGRVVGFSGRALGPVKEQKYINSPELPFFKKGELLFGLQAAKEQLRRSREAILVEGNFDVVTLHAAGFRTTVAPMGTALTANQLELLRRLADSVVILFDGDEAGRKAMSKALEPCYSVGLAVRAAELPQGEDPDSYVRRQGAGALRELLERARPLAELVVDGVVAPVLGGGVEERVRAARAAGQVLAVLPAGPIRTGYIEEVARRLQLRPSEVVVERAAAEAITSTTRAERAPALSPQECMLLKLIVEQPGLATRAYQGDEAVPVFSEQMSDFVRRVADAWELEGQGLRIERLIDELNEGIREEVLKVVSGVRDYREDLEQSFGLLMSQFEARQIEREKQQLTEEARAADRSGDESRLREVAERLRELNRAQAQQKQHGG